jgi:hypothetical protein
VFSHEQYRADSCDESPLNSLIPNDRTRQRQAGAIVWTSVIPENLQQYAR